MIYWKKYEDIHYQDMLEAGGYVLRMFDVTTPQTKEDYLEYKRCIRKILEILTYDDIEEIE